jgi:aspartate/methionine/tyrosine aminotransferase
MKMSERATELRSSPISDAKAWLGHRKGGTPLLDLSQAAPSYPPAPVVADRIAEVARCADGGAYAPSFGITALTEAFAARLSADYEGTVTNREVLPTAGCNQAFCVVASALAGPGDEVLMHLPYYFNHAMWLEAEGILPRFVPIGTDFVPDPERAAALINDRTRAILLVTPGNPTGVTIPPSVIDSFASLAAEHGIALIIDETYRNFRETEAPPHRQFAEPNWQNTTISLHSFSKDLAIPGYRVGAIVAGTDLLDQAAKLLDCVAICAPRISQEAALTGLLSADAWRREQADRIADNLALFRSTMASSPGGFELAASGAFFGWVRHPFTSMATDDVVKHLVLDHDVLVIPGTAFMPSDERWLRFSFANLDGDEFTELAIRLEQCGAALAG